MAGDAEPAGRRPGSSRPGSVCSSLLSAVSAVAFDLEVALRSLDEIVLFEAPPLVESLLGAVRNDSGTIQGAYLAIGGPRSSGSRRKPHQRTSRPIASPSTPPIT